MAKIIGNTTATPYPRPDWNQTDETKADFIKNKPTIPSIDGLASEIYVDNKVASLVDSAPETLNTLNELSEALGNDSNFATTVATEIGKKAGEKVKNNAEIFNDYENNKAEGLYSHVEGHQNRAISGVILRGVTEYLDNNFIPFENGIIPLNKEGFTTICSEADVWGFRLTSRDQNNKLVYVDIVKLLETNYSDDGITILFQTEIPIAEINIDTSEWLRIEVMINSENVIGADFTHIEGHGNIVTGVSNHAEGGSTLATGWYSHAEGLGTQSNGKSSHVEGYKSIANGECSHAEGYTTIADEESAHAEGHKTISTGIGSHAEGNATTASGNYSHAEGSGTISSNKATHAEGFKTVSAGNYSHAEGEETISNASNSHAEGYRTNANGSSSHAEGSGTIAAGSSSHAEGQSTQSNGKASHAEGYNTTADKDYSHAEGNGTQSNGGYSHAEGYKSIATGDGSHAEGNSNAIGLYSHAEGLVTSSNGGYSHAEGQLAQSNGKASHAEGFKSEANGNYSHAEGQETYSNGSNSHAEGYRAEANGSSSHAEGNYTRALGAHSHAEGEFTIAKGVSSHVQGKYNIEDVDSDGNPTNKYAHIVGNGTGNDNRSNAHTLDWDGNAWFAGTVTVGADNKELATKEYVDNNSSNNSVGEATEKGGEIFNDYENNKADLYSHAEGQNTKAYHTASHTEGRDTKTIFDYSHAEGYGTTAGHYYDNGRGGIAVDGQCTHAEGYYTVASGNYSHVQGKYNKIDPIDYSGNGKYAHIVGNGTDSGHRSNAHTLDWDGNAWFAGTVTVGADNKELATVENIPTKVSELENDSYFMTGTPEYAWFLECLYALSNTNAENLATKSYVDEQLGVIENGSY